MGHQKFKPPSLGVGQSSALRACGTCREGGFHLYRSGRLFILLRNLQRRWFSLLPLGEVFYSPKELAEKVVFT